MVPTKITSGVPPTITSPSSTPQDNANKETTYDGKKITLSEGDSPNKPTNTKRSGLAPVKRFAGFTKKIITGLSPNRDNPSNTKVATPARPSLESMSNKDMILMQAEIVLNGTTAGKKNFQAKVQSKEPDFKQAQRFFLSGDPGIRRTVTALHNLRALTPPPDLPEAIKSQAQTLCAMAGQVADSGFNTSIPTNFTQYGDVGANNPYYDVIEDGYIHLEPQIRAWAGKGTELAHQLAEGMQRACSEKAEPQLPFTESELATLQRQVDDFANMESRSAPDPESLKRGPVTGKETAI